MTQTQSTLEQVLLDYGLVTKEQFDQTRERALASQVPIIQLLVADGHVSERDLSRATSVQNGVPFADLQNKVPSPEVLKSVPAEVIRRRNALPVKLQDGKLVVAMVDPMDHEAIEEIGRVSGLEIIRAGAHGPDLTEAMDRCLTDVAATSVNNGAASPGAQPVKKTAASAPLLPTTDDGKEPDLTEFLNAVLDMNASDLHLTCGIPPMIRIDGELKPLLGYRSLRTKDLQDLIYSMLSQKQRKQFEEELELDLSFALPGRGRFRVNVYKQRDSMGAALRRIPFKIDSLEELGLPAVLEEFTRLRRGLVLVTGITGSGKSTTLASLINEINVNRSDHIMTVEDPIEFLHKHKRSVVNQREIGADTRSFDRALRHVLRQDPDVILIGELRDLETIQTALTAAETGHLVFATLHTQDAPQSIDRVIDVFPPHQQNQIRIQLAGTLVGVVSQQLIPRADGVGRVAATEILMVTDAVKNLIREGKTHQIYTSMQSGAKFGMQVMDSCLAHLVKSNEITYEMALERCHHPEDLKRLSGRG